MDWEVFAYSTYEDIINSVDFGEVWSVHNVLVDIIHKVSSGIDSSEDFVHTSESFVNTFVCAVESVDIENVVFDSIHGLNDVYLWNNVFVEQDWVLEVHFEGGGSPHMLEQWGSQVLVEGWVVQSLTEYWEGQVLLEQGCLEQSLQGVDCGGGGHSFHSGCESSADGGSGRHAIWETAREEAGSTFDGVQVKGRRRSDQESCNNLKDEYKIRIICNKNQ